ncbi:hypothetical protein KKB44_06610 [Candidatus Micrarchaeota archaeon]|nr:hypothetical protein [Candidatus Micrarchaeota archaeon]
MDKDFILVGIVMLIFMGFAVFAFGGTNIKNENNNSVNYDTFAQCLAEKGVIMYGAYWCGHCNNQKAMFGDSWQYVDYIECSTSTGQAQECTDADITGYPTWEFSGQKVPGELSFEDISRYSGCELD